MDSCIICSGVLTFLGRLGRLVWFRCQNCGHDQKVAFSELSEEEQEAVRELEAAV